MGIKTRLQDCLHAVILTPLGGAESGECQDPEVEQDQEFPEFLRQDNHLKWTSNSHGNFVLTESRPTRSLLVGWQTVSQRALGTF